MGLEGRVILLTGGSGFVGSHLAAELQRRGARVVILDARGDQPVDLRDWAEVRRFAEAMGEVDLVYHLAALMFVPYSFENPRETYEVNVLGTLNILELCRSRGIGKLVFASSYVYGEPRYLPVDESHPLNPASPYARSKVLGEALCRAYHEDYGLDVTVLRPFNIYGEGQSGSFLIPSIIEQMAAGRIELQDPEPKRDFLHVSDAVEAYVRAGEYDSPGFEVFNIGAGVSYSVREVVTMLLEAWGHEVPVTYRNERRRGEVMNVVADTRKAKALLGWEARVPLDDGLLRYVRWFEGDTSVKSDRP